MTMTLGTASVCLTVFVLNLHYHATLVPLPDWIPRLARKQYLTGYLAGYHATLVPLPGTST